MRHKAVVDLGGRGGGIRRGGGVGDAVSSLTV